MKSTTAVKVGNRIVAVNKPRRRRRRAVRYKWTKERIIASITQRASAGQSLRRFHVLAEVPCLVIAAAKYLGNWSKALLSAGFDPKCIIPYKEWTKHSVVESIQARLNANAPLNSRAVQKENPNLFRAACRRIGSWNNALSAAGIDVSTIRRQRPEWTKEAIIRTIQSYVELGRPLNAEKVRPLSLRASGYRLWGSWDGALRAAGLDPKLIRVKRAWTKIDVLQEIASRVSGGLPINSAAVQKDGGSLLIVARSIFGTWHEALRNAGFIPERVRRCSPRWTRSQIITAMREYEDKGYTLSPSRVRPYGLRYGAKRLFGSWKGALRAAGLPYLAEYKGKFRNLHFHFARGKPDERKS